MSCFPKTGLYTPSMMTARSIIPVMVLIMATQSFADVGATDGFNKYKVIIEKSPFRKGAPTATGPAAPTVESLTLKGYVAGDGLKKVWILDTKTNKSSYVGEGDMVLDYKIISIDAENQVVVLRKGITDERLAFPIKTQAAPMVPNTGRPTYRGPTRPMTPSPSPMPAPVPAAAAAAAAPGGATPAP